MDKQDLYALDEAIYKQVKKKRKKHNQPTQHYKYCPMCGQLMGIGVTSSEYKKI